MSPARILVVDDEQDVQGMLQRVIAGSGYETIAASSGLEGLMRAQNESPNLILLDVMMHPMDGWETLKLLKLDPQTSAIPVVVVSARAEPKDKIRALQEGATDYVTKPFSLREIRDKIEVILRSSPAGSTGQR